MTATTSTDGRPGSAAQLDHVDMLIVGAGLTGIGAACRLAELRPGSSFAIFEGRDAIGGTWDLFRYPGVRSDSDMFTLGYPFRPWPEARAIADGPSIREYVRATAREFGVDQAIRFQHRVISADWDSAAARWMVTAEDGATGDTVHVTCSWLSACTGYYRYDQGHRPAFPGQDRFPGTLVYPQSWPQDLDWTGKQIVVIGSGATAVTLVPSLAERAAHVTMLQRTPSYVLSLPGVDPMAKALMRLLPDRLAHPIVRWKSAIVATLLYEFSQRRPKAMRKLLRKGAVSALPEGYDVDVHFNPPYKPWDQRMCLIPDGDLYASLSSGRAEVVTDRIATFTEHGIELASGRRLDADIIVSATGLTLLALGGIQLRVDGNDVELPKTVLYKGMMLSGVPNFNFVFGYTNNSWTLRADLVNRYVIRLLAFMDRSGYDRAIPAAPADEPADEPFLDLTSGYVQRGLGDLPRQGRRAPWRMHHNYLRDSYLMRRSPLEDEGMTFWRATPQAKVAASERALAG
ncbi:MAG TPA: NAD(P)/FAD-dependent oxidoreductase [Frankiaceae bacterium]|jgi:cation diffusion facilitator CzcD-associated flavoprotein CzcO|nr:NAD(P)/FAD-dependent oxidoreductase [Frankiaceae bacterium]